MEISNKKIQTALSLMITVLFFILFQIMTAQAATAALDTVTLSSNAIFVDRKGSDDNSGTITEPFATLQKALDNVAPGQTIYIRKGTYKGYNTVKTSGKKNQWITITSYPGERVVLKGISNKNGAIIDLGGCKYINIENLEIGKFRAMEAYGILLDEQEKHITIRGNRIHHIATKSKDGEANAILCIGYAAGDKKAISDILIAENDVYSNSTGWCESISVTGNSHHVYVIGNKVHNNKNIGIDFCGNFGYCKNPKYDRPHDCVAKGNTVYKNKCGYAECAGIYADGAYNINITQNTVYKNMFGIEVGAEEKNDDYPTENITVSDNEIYANPDGGIRVGGYEIDKTGWVKNTQIYGNKLNNNGSGSGIWSGELNLSQCDGVYIHDNEIYKKSKYAPIIGTDFENVDLDKYIKNIRLENNVLYSTKKEIKFDMSGDWKLYGEEYYDKLFKN